MNDEREDGLRRRLRAADPVPSDRVQLAGGRSIEQLVEDTMTDTVDEAKETKQPARWRIVAVAAAVVAVASAGGAYLATRNDSPGGHARTVVSLKLPGSASPGRPGQPGGACILFTVELLAKQQLAFSGTVESVGDGTVSISVDHWYKGGNADEVDLTMPDSPNAVNEFGLTFDTGHRYLVSANDGTVTGCGYTGEYSADRAAEFARAFGS